MPIRSSPTRPPAGQQAMLAATVCDRHAMSTAMTAGYAPPAAGVFIFTFSSAITFMRGNDRRPGIRRNRGGMEVLW